MARYIDADELIKKIFPYDVVDKKRYAINAEAVYKAIQIVTAADVEEVVRCKDCKHAQELNNFEQRCYVEGCISCTQIHPMSDRLVMLPTDFCSYGERKEK